MSKLNTVGVKFYRENSRYALDGAFSSTKVYHYATDQEAHVDDYALVVGANGELCITKVVETEKGISSKVRKSVVTIVSMKGYQERSERLNQFLELQKAIERRAEEVRKQRSFEEVLSNDAVGQELLRKFKELEGLL